jgi:hypothetical protein
MAVIWRYLDFPKLVSLIYKKSLHFGRIDLLGDPWEYRLSIPSERALMRHFKSLGTPDNYLLPAVNQYRDTIQQYFVSCWYMSEHESSLMWKAYSLESQGIVIKSKYMRLIEALQGAPEDINVGVVKYADYDRDLIPIGNSFEPAVHKRKFFKEENEVRAVFWSKAKTNSDLHPHTEGWKNINIKVNLEMLIDSIIVGPLTGYWYKELIEDLLKKEGLNIEVKHSGM